MSERIGVLLVNLGTPDTPLPTDVRRYLIEFLMDGRVINAPWLVRNYLVRGLIVPKRYRQSAKTYQDIWTPEGSPLKVYGKKVAHLLQEKLGNNYRVALAMRYRYPSIEKTLDTLIQAHVDEIIVLPLFPQYASATTGSIHEKVMSYLSKKQHIPQIRFINSFATNPLVINAFCAVAQPYDLNLYDHILFSFHGLPQKQLVKACEERGCKKPACQTPACCHTLHAGNRTCYAAQCYATAHAIAQRLHLEKTRYSIAFQSRLGKDPWIEPFTSDQIADLAHKGAKRLLVFCPSFVCDCLETTSEIGMEYAAEFYKEGGEKLDLVPGLNDHPAWIEALAGLVQ